MLDMTVPRNIQTPEDLKNVLNELYHAIAQLQQDVEQLKAR